MSRRFRSLVLSIVKHEYIPLAVAEHADFDLVAVADQPDVPAWIHERNQQFADRFEIAYVRDIETAIREHRPDVAVVSSEAERHCELAVKAADAGLHIIVDKPLSNRLNECERLVAATERANVRSLVWNRNRLPAIIQAQKAIESGKVGELRAIHCDFYFAKDAGPPKGTRAAGQPPIDWLQRQIEAHADGSDGGVGVEPLGELQIEGIYPLAYIHMLSGKPVQRVFARTATHFHQANVDNHVDDLASVTLEMEDGVVGSLAIGRIGAASHPDIGEIKLHIIGTKGALIVSEARPEVGVYYRNQPTTEFRHIRVEDQNNTLLLDDFVEAIDTGRETILDARAGRDICAVVEACIRSSRSSQVETVA